MSPIDEVEHGIAFKVASDGTATEGAWREGPTLNNDAGFDWVHINLGSEEAQQWLAEGSGLDPIVADALSEEETRPRCVPLLGGLLINLRGVNLNPGADPEDMVSLRVWAEDGRVISARRRPLTAIQGLRDDLRAGRGPRSAGDFLVEVAARLVERMSAVLAELAEQVDGVEEILADWPLAEQRSQLIAIRRQAIALRRYLAPQREALARLGNEKVTWLEDSHRLRLREVADSTIRYVEDLEAARERSAITQEELNGRLAEQLNRRMYALSVIAGVFLPLGFVTGLLGVNVAGIPGSENLTSFPILCGLLALMGAGQLFLFRKLEWL